MSYGDSSQRHLVQRGPLSGDQDETSRVSGLERRDNRSGTSAAYETLPKNKNSNNNSKLFVWPYNVPGIVVSLSHEQFHLLLQPLVR